jgi:hypothetical protein
MVTHKPFANPKGIESISPGLRGTSYPGSLFNKHSQPQRGCGHFISVDGRDVCHNPAGTAIEMACIVGYFLQNVAQSDERKTAIKGEDVDKYFRQAGYPLPKAKGQLLVDAKSSGYFDSAGVGAYKLNAVGYNLVAHSLPRGAKAKK